MLYGSILIAFSDLVSSNYAGITGRGLSMAIITACQ